MNAKISSLLWGNNVKKNSSQKSAHTHSWQAMFQWYMFARVPFKSHQFFFFRCYSLHLIFGKIFLLRLFFFFFFFFVEREKTQMNVFSFSGLFRLYLESIFIRLVFITFDYLNFYLKCIYEYERVRFGVYFHLECFLHAPTTLSVFFSLQFLGVLFSYQNFRIFVFTQKSGMCICRNKFEQMKNKKKRIYDETWNVCERDFFLSYARLPHTFNSSPSLFL